MSERFGNVPDSDALDFAAAYPLAWVVPCADPSAALLMPVLVEEEEVADRYSVLGHLPKRSPVVDILRRDGAAVFLFLGANAYIPPGWVSKEGWAPTWNFLSLKIHATQTQVDDVLTRSAVESLVQHMEERAGSDWTVEEIGSRYDALLDGIIGFRSSVTRLEPRFKTGQDESVPVRDDIKRALGSHPLTRWMD